MTGAGSTASTSSASGFGLQLSGVAEMDPSSDRATCQTIWSASPRPFDLITPSATLLNGPLMAAPIPCLKRMYSVLACSPTETSAVLVPTSAPTSASASAHQFPRRLPHWLLLAPLLPSPFSHGASMHTKRPSYGRALQGYLLLPCPFFLLVSKVTKFGSWGCTNTKI